MSNKYEDIILQAQKIIYCPACGRHYEVSEIKLRGCLDNAYILQTICSRGHTPLMTIFVTSYQNGAEKPQVHKQVENKEKLTTDDVIKAHQQIERFNGDFIKLWGNLK